MNIELKTQIAMYTAFEGAKLMAEHADSTPREIIEFILSDKTGNAANCLADIVRGALREADESLAYK